MPQIIAETPELIVLNKPAGLICHSDGRTVEPSIAAWLAEHYPECRGVGDAWISPQGESVDICGLVHRLDRTTSGIVLVARTQAMWEYLRGEFKARRVEKTYRAIVYGHIAADTGRIVAAIQRTSDRPRRWIAVPCVDTHRRAAITEWRVLARGADAGEPWSCVELYPRTGRTHQIRLHMASIGHPVVVDHLYAGERPPLLRLGRPALHALAISLVLPSGKRVSYAAPLPRDMVGICAHAQDA